MQNKLIMFFRSLFLFVLLSDLANAQIVAIKAGKIVDPSASKVYSNQIILIENGKIREVGSDLKIPDNAKVIDLSKSTIIPGLVDAHTHICARISKFADMLGIDFLDLVLLDSDGYRAIQGTYYAKQMLEAGFTTIREAGNSGKYADVDVKRSINEGLTVGPSILAAGRIIAPFGGQFRTKADKQFIQNNEYFFADTHDEIRKAIRENIYYGVDVIKIVVDSKRYKYSIDDIKFIVSEARQAKLKVMAHCQSLEGAYNAAVGGVSSIEHGWTLPDSILSIMKQKNITLVSTDFPVRVLQEYGSDKDNAIKFHSKLVERLKRAYLSGITIAFGSDIMIDFEGQNRGVVALSYIDCFIEAGIPNADILKIFTVNAAQLLGVDSMIGSISPGKQCDLIAVDESPLDNIMALKKVSFVMKKGVVYKDIH